MIYTAIGFLIIGGFFVIVNLIQCIYDRKIYCAEYVKDLFGFLIPGFVFGGICMLFGLLDFFF